MPNIPKKLHFIWMGKDLPRKYLRNIAFWARRNSSYQVHLWTNKAMRIHASMVANDDIPSFKHFVRDTEELRIQPYLKSLILREMNGPFNNYAAASDMLRLAILQTEGGVYLDTDVECSSAPADLRAAITWLAPLRTLNAQFGFLVAAGTPASSSVPQNAVLAATAQNEIVAEIMTAIMGYYRHGYVDRMDSWVNKRLPAAKDDAYAPRRILTIGMSGPSVVEEVLTKRKLVSKGTRRINSLVLFPTACVRIPCDKNWLGIGTYRPAEI